MRLTKLTHACVRLEKDPDQDPAAGEVLVIDPGELTERGALEGATAVLITHEHFDHLDTERVTAAVRADPRLRVWTNPAVAARLDHLGARVRAVGAGDSFTAAGFEVGVYGERHAAIHPDLPVVPNVGFLVDGTLFHPGDAFTVPDRPVGTLLVPASGPWMKAAEMIDYVRHIAPHHAFSVHDGLLNDPGLGVIDTVFGVLDSMTTARCRRLAPGEHAVV